MRRWLTRLGQVWRLLPVSAGGLLAAMVAWWVYTNYGLAHSDFVVHSACLVMLAVVGASFLATGLAGLILYLTVRRAGREMVEGRINAGTEIRTGLEIPGFRFWPMVQVEMRWAAPVDVDVQLVSVRGRLHERAIPRSRGRFSEIHRRFTVRDIFGLAHMAFDLRAPAHLQVAPAPASGEVAFAVRHASGEGYAHPSGQAEGDRVEMRRYAPGDSTRMILWRVYARTRQLLVRVPERAIAPQPSAVACFVAGKADEPTASAARMFVEQGLLGADFSFVADGEDTPAHTRAEAIERIIDSVHHRHRSGTRLSSLLEEHDRAELTNCVIFVPGVRGPWLESLRNLLTSLPNPPTIVLAVDGDLVPMKRHSRLRRWALHAPSEHTTLSQLPALYDDLIVLGGPVWVVHRPTGQLITTPAMDRLR